MKGEMPKLLQARLLDASDKVVQQGETNEEPLKLYADDPLPRIQLKPWNNISGTRELKLTSNSQVVITWTKDLDWVTTPGFSHFANLTVEQRVYRLTKGDGGGSCIEDYTERLEKGELSRGFVFDNNRTARRMVCSRLASTASTTVWERSSVQLLQTFAYLEIMPSLPQSFKAVNANTSFILGKSVPLRLQFTAADGGNVKLPADVGKTYKRFVRFCLNAQLWLIEHGRELFPDLPVEMETGCATTEESRLLIQGVLAIPEENEELAFSTILTVYPNVINADVSLHDWENELQRHEAGEIDLRVGKGEGRPLGQFWNGDRTKERDMEIQIKVLACKLYIAEEVHQDTGQRPHFFEFVHKDQQFVLRCDKVKLKKGKNEKRHFVKHTGPMPSIGESYTFLRAPDGIVRQTVQVKVLSGGDVKMRLKVHLLPS